MENQDKATGFARIYEKHQNEIFRFCYLRVSDKELGMDLAQQTFLKAWKQVEGGENIDNPKAFLFQIARNLIIDWYRKKKEYSLDAMMEEGYDIPDHTSVDQMLENAEMGIVLRAMKTLSKPEYDMVTMRYVDGLPVQEIAEILGKKDNTVAVELYRATKKLREKVNKIPK